MSIKNEPKLIYTNVILKIMHTMGYNMIKNTSVLKIINNTNLLGCYQLCNNSPSCSVFVHTTDSTPSCGLINDKGNKGNNIFKLISYLKINI